MLSAHFPRTSPSSLLAQLAHGRLEGPDNERVVEQYLPRSFSEDLPKERFPRTTSSFSATSIVTSSSPDTSTIHTQRPADAISVVAYSPEYIRKGEAHLRRQQLSTKDDEAGW